MRLYRYVGPKQIAERARGAPGGEAIRSPADVLRWVVESGQVSGEDRCVIATFVIDQAGVLRVADRRSEHVACAGGEPVRSAGEITFRIGQAVWVVEISNQSTGYCPEPESWPAVELALTQAGLAAPEGFSPSCDFRLCPSCGAKNLIKSGSFACGVCDAELPASYNCQGEEFDSPGVTEGQQP